MTAYQQTHQRTAWLHYEGSDYNGRQIVVDVAEITPGRFTVAALDAEGNEIESDEVEDLDTARRLYGELFRRLTEKPATKPLSGKYAKLRDDLRAALEAGRNAEHENPEDGGTCNFDSVALNLPRWQAAKVEQAAKEAGTSCFSWDLFGGRRWVFGPDTRAQGNARTRNAEAMTRALAGMGYQAMDYCQMD